MAPTLLKSYTASIERKLSSCSDERRAMQCAIESYYALPGVPDEECESVDLHDFFNDNGVIAPESPRNWVLLASLGRPLSRSRPSTEQHGSLSTRQQLLNSQTSLENARKRAQFQRKATSQFQEHTNGRAVDIQRLRHLHLVFQPLEYVPCGPIFKKHIAQVYMEDTTLNPEEEDPEDQALMNKGTGSAMNNDQRALLHMIFRRSIMKVTGKGGRATLMYRWTWFRFLIHCQLLGPDGSWDMKTPSETRVPWSLAVKIFKLFQEPNSQPPALSFSGWANAMQAAIRAKGLYTTAPEVIEAVFSTFIPRAQSALGISDHEASREGTRSQSISSSTHGGRSNSRAMSRSLSRSQSRSMSRSLSRSQSRNMGRSMSRTMSKVGRSSSRALSVFSAADSTCEDSDDETMNDDGKLPLVWQINLAEQQVCEPECLQLLHEYCGLLQILFHHYADGETMAQERFTTLLKELRFFPDFVQRYSLKKHLNATEARYAEEDLGFAGFVETLCRICFCFLNIYGNTAQQFAASKYKMLWVLALLEARLPRKFRSKHSADEEEPDNEPLDREQPQGADSLWHQRNADFNISVCANKDIILWQTMEKLANALPIVRATGGATSTMENEIDKALSMLRR